MKSVVNESTVTELIMVGLTDDPDLEKLLFCLLFPIYIFTLLGNISIMVIVWLSSNLHTPMYFFLTHLAFLDMAIASTISPKTLVNLLIEKKTISLFGCITQIFSFAAWGSTEFFLLSSMAYDRYVAICNPLLYTLIMTENLCGRLIAGSYFGGFLHSTIHAACLARLHFCGPNVINNFLCDYTVLLKLSCTDISINNMVRFTVATFVVLSTISVIIVSYSFIVTTIGRTPSTKGRQRAASTCISHFVCVIFYYGSAFLMEIRPHSSSSEEQNKVIAVLPTIFVPAMNPLIYSLRNKEVKEALRRILFRKKNCRSGTTSSFRS